MTNSTTTPHTVASTTFGEHARYRLDTFATRFGGIEYMVFDAYVEDEITGGPACVRQSSSVYEIEAVYADQPKVQIAIEKAKRARDLHESK